MIFVSNFPSKLFSRVLGRFFDDTGEVTMYMVQYSSVMMVQLAGHNSSLFGYFISSRGKQMTVLDIDTRRRYFSDGDLSSTLQLSGNVFCNFEMMQGDAL